MQKFTAVLGPWKKTDLYLNFGTGFHSNNPRGVDTTRDPSTGDLVATVDPLVRTIGAEIGERTQLIPKVTATFAAWWLESDSELVYFGDEGSNEPGPASRRYALETAIYWSPKDWLVFDAEVAITHVRFLDSPGAEYIPDSVPWMVSGGFSREQCSVIPRVLPAFLRPIPIRQVMAQAGLSPFTAGQRFNRARLLTAFPFHTGI